MYNLQIPDSIYEWAQKQAQQTKQSVDEILLSYINRLPIFTPVLPADEEAELVALHYLSDDALWTIAREIIPEPQQQRMQTLMDKNSSGKITPDEHNELSKLVERGQQLTLRKSEAMAILAERGHHVSLKESDTRE